MTVDAPGTPEAPAHPRQADGSAAALGLAAGAVSVLVASWFRPVGLLVLLPVVALLVWRRSASSSAGALVGASLPILAMAMWTSTTWLAATSVVLLVCGLAVVALTPPPGATALLGPVGTAVAGVLAGMVAGFVLVSSLFLVGYLPMVLVLCAAVWAGGRRALPWIVGGAALMPLWVGLNNLGGPGTRCGSDADSQWCHELADPRPFLMTAAVLLLLAASTLIVARTRRPAAA